MILRFSEEFTPYTNGLAELEILCAHLGEGLNQLFERFPQLYVRLMDNHGEVGRASCFLFDGEPIWELREIYRPVQPAEVLSLEKVPQGADSGWDFFVDPLASRLIQDKQVFGMQGYGWTMPGAKQIFGEQTANELAGYGMMTVGYILSITGVGALVGGLLVVMGGWSLDAAGAVVPGVVNNSLNNSATYTFNGVRNTTASGTPFQIVYGEHRVGGQVLNLYTSLENSQDGDTAITSTHLHAQIGLCEGEISGVSEVELNKLPLNYYNAITTAPDPDFLRRGTADQTTMPAFTQVESSFTVGKKVAPLKSAFTPSARTDVASVEPVYGIVQGKKLKLGPYKWVTTESYYDENAG